MFDVTLIISASMEMNLTALNHINSVSDLTKREALNEWKFNTKPENFHWGLNRN